MSRKELLEFSQTAHEENVKLAQQLAKANERVEELESENTNGNAAAEHLRQLTRRYPGQEHLWLRLAEAEGMGRNIVGVHRARAEYDALMGDLESAQRQLRQAQEKLPAGSPQRQVVTERLAEITRRLNAQKNR
jgi:predicted Zn-dependent protease